MTALPGVAASRGATEVVAVDVAAVTPAETRSSNSGRGDILKDKCRYCGIEGHWARDCRKKKKEEANLAQQVDEEEPAFLMMEVCAVVTQSVEPAGGVHLVEERAHVNLGRVEETEPGW